MNINFMDICIYTFSLEEKKNKQRNKKILNEIKKRLKKRKYNKK